MNDTFCIVPLDGLKDGHSSLEWHLDRKFFDEFENSDILSADFAVRCEIDKTGNYFGVDCLIDGEVVVECDRCLADLSIPVNTAAYLSVKFTDIAEPVSEETDSIREMYFAPADCAELDLSQVIYDYICISLPLQKVHPNGECDPEVKKYLSTETEEVVEEEKTDSPFASLKNILEKK